MRAFGSFDFFSCGVVRDDCSMLQIVWHGCNDDRDDQIELSLFGEKEVSMPTPTEFLSDL